MSSFDDNPFPQHEPEPQVSELAPFAPAEIQPPAAAPESSLSGDPISLAATSPHPWPAKAPKSDLPEDLRISWSWLHFVVFVLFGLVSFFIVQASFAIYYAPTLRNLRSQKDLERFVLSKPGFAIGSMVIVYALVFLFLYITLAVYPRFPFWRTLGWRRIKLSSGALRNPWLYFFGGCALSVLVFIATAKMKAPPDVPIEELFRYKNTALFFMAMAVLVAPLVEETVFRGYLYPLLAKTFGVATGIITTGILFGLMHGAQLGWTWALVSVLIVVGVIFTFVRARTGSVFASFLLHLGYNSTIAFFTILATQGFTKMPTPH